MIRSERYSKDNLAIQDIFIHQIVPNFVNSIPSCKCNCYCVGQNGIITMMISSSEMWLVRKFWMIDMWEVWNMLSFTNLEMCNWLQKIHVYALNLKAVITFLTNYAIKQLNINDMLSTFENFVCSTSNCNRQNYRNFFWKAPKGKHINFTAKYEELPRVLLPY